MAKTIVASKEELSKVIDELKGEGIVLLVGNLASGKTTLVKEFVKSLGLKDDTTSPTFSVMNIYDNKVYHYDIYNEGTQKFLESGLLENLEQDGYHFIEWADDSLEELLKTYGFSYKKVQISPKENKREYKIWQH